MEYQFTYGLTDSLTTVMQISSGRRGVETRSVKTYFKPRHEPGVKERGGREVGRNNSSNELFPLARRPLTRIDRVSGTSFRRSNLDRAP